MNQMSAGFWTQQGNGVCATPTTQSLSSQVTTPCLRGPSSGAPDAYSWRKLKGGGGGVLLPAPLALRPYIFRHPLEILIKVCVTPACSSLLSDTSDDPQKHLDDDVTPVEKDHLPASRVIEAT